MSASPFYFDDDAADRAEQFFSECLTHVKGERAGEPFVLEGWQRDDIIRPLFGWKRREDGTRRYRMAYIEVPKKNGKSSLCAGLALYLLAADGEVGAEVYSAAGDREQAAIVFDVARSMRDASPELRKRTRTFRRSLVYAPTASSYKVLSADVETKHGFDIHGLIFDELHVQRDRKLWDALTTGVAARRQPLTIAITTAGWDRRTICWEQHELAMNVLTGVLDMPDFLAVIYAADERDDWRDERVWAKANPNLGVSVKLDYLRAEAQRAESSPARLNTFKRLHLNLWTAQSERWLEQELWTACGGPARLEDLAGRLCYGGVDLASRRDVAALVLVFPFDDDPLPEAAAPDDAPAADEGAPDPDAPDADRHRGRRYVVIPRFWIPKANLTDAKLRRDPRLREVFQRWVDEGSITATPGNIIDYDVIRAEINALAERVDLPELGIDPHDATQLTTQLQGDGFKIVPMRQHFGTMSAPTKDLERLVRGGRLAHGGHPVLAWMFGNMAVRTNAEGQLRPDKERSSEKIDGIVALIMALDRAARHPGSSVYEGRGVMVLA